jgi:arylsulfatase A-like enzyme
MITRMDTCVGRLLDELNRLDLAGRTLVLFSSDNGPHKESGHDPALFKPSGPVRGYKRDLTEGGIRVPCIAWWPGTIAPGSESAHAFYFGDLMATAAELAGVKPPANIDSLSFVPTLRGRPGEQQQHHFLYWEFHEGGFRQAALMDGHWKGIRKAVGAPVELYDLAADLAEARELSAEQPEMARQLDQYLRTARSDSEHWPVRPAPRKPVATPRE